MRSRRGPPKGRNPQKTNANKPPQIQSNVRVSHKYRFTSTSATPTIIHVGDLLGAAGTIGIVLNSLVATIANGVQLKSVEVWTPPASQGASATCSVSWEGALNAISSEVSDTTMSVATPAHIRAIPPANSQAKFWQNISSISTALFTLIAPPGSVIDVVMNLVLNDDDDPTASFFSPTVATAQLGRMYYLALDTAQTGTHIYPPVSLTTTF
jgi:hypothetical protein